MTTATQQGEHAQFGFKAAGAEWLEALHKAQKVAKQIERTKGIPDARGKIKFYIAAAEDFVNESRRVLHDHGMGWFRQGTQLTEVNAHTGTLKLTSCFIVYHSPSGQAQICYAEWTARSDGDAMAAAHTRVTRRFIQGLLQIAVVDEGASSPDPEDKPGHGCAHPQTAFFGNPQWNAQHSVWVDQVICQVCGESLDWQPCPAPPQQQQQIVPPQPQTPPPQPAQQMPPPAPPPQQAPQQPPPQAPPQSSYATGPGYQPLANQPRPPVMAEPIVQQAQQAFAATPITEKQMKEEQSAPVTAAANPGAPGSPEAWRDALIAKGLDAAAALQVAMLEDTRNVELEFVDKMRNWAFSYYSGDIEKITSAWEAVGFTPVPSLPVDQRPRPTGLQAKQFLTAITFKSATADA
jgi:hypothetical protein